MKNLNGKFEFSEIDNNYFKSLMPEGMEFFFEINNEGGLTAVCKLSESFDVSQKVDPWLTTFCDALKHRFPDEIISSRVNVSIDRSQHDLESFCHRFNCFVLTNGGEETLLAANKAKELYQGLADGDKWLERNGFIKVAPSIQ